MAPTRSLALLFLFLLLPISSHSRTISLVTPDPSSISDGLSSHLTPSFLRLGAAEECEQTYGFLPCTTTALGNLFLLVVYGYLMFWSATLLSNGSEMLLEILGPGIVGGLFLPILGALPDAILILVSGLSGTKEVAQEQVLIGMGLLAGSTVMLLTIVWGSCVVVGKCDFDENDTAIDLQDTKKFSLRGSGVATDVLTSYAARIMVISVIPFIIVQLPQTLNTTAGDRVTVLIALICSVALLLSYSLYQICQPWIQKRKLAYAKHKHVISGILHHAHKHGIGRLLNNDGSPNESVIEKLFDMIDLDCDNSLSHQELAALIIGIQFDVVDLDEENAAAKVMAEFDTSGDAAIDRVEFLRGISSWLSVAKSVSPRTGANSIVHNFHARTREEHDQLIDKSDEVIESVEDPTWLYVKALSLLLLGTVIVVSFADPLVDAVNNFSSATGIPSFFISFIAMPLATNSSEAVSALIFASRKKRRTSSLTFSEIYGAVTMNNTLCLAVFLGLVYVRGLKWDFSSEVLIIVIVCVVMGLFTSFRTKFPLWTCSVAYVLYPFSLVLVYVLDFVFGWS